MGRELAVLALRSSASWSLPTHARPPAGQHSTCSALRRVSYQDALLCGSQPKLTTQILSERPFVVTPFVVTFL